MRYVNVRTDGAFVADMALSTTGSSYTRDITKAKIYHSLEAAQRDCCAENERSIPMDAFFAR
jgi:hypothetical protein